MYRSREACASKCWSSGFSEYDFDYRKCRLLAVENPSPVRSVHSIGVGYVLMGVAPTTAIGRPLNCNRHETAGNISESGTEYGGDVVYSFCESSEQEALRHAVEVQPAWSMWD
jgi:hypothetical protein